MAKSGKGKYFTICYLTFGFLNFLLAFSKFKQSLALVKYVSLFLTFLKSIVFIITYPELLSR